MLALIVLVSSWLTADRIVAVVGEIPVLRSEVISRIQETVSSEAECTAAVSDSAAFASFLGEIVDERLLVEGARAAGFFPSIEVTASLVDSRIEEMRAGYGSEEQFLAAMAVSGLTLEEVQNRLFELMSEQKAASDFVQSIAAVDIASLPADPVRYLNDNLPVLEDELMPRNLSWILVPVLPGGSDASDALSFLSDLAGRAGAGEPFEALARQYSEDPGSASEGGYLGQFAPGDMTPAFERALDLLYPGEVSPPFLSPYGAHLARLDSRDSTGNMTASHILILLDLDADDEARALGLADSISGLLETGSVSFEEAASRWSLDPMTSSKGGALGVVLVKNSIPEAVRAVESLSPGQVSIPVRLGDGSAIALIRLDSSLGSVDWSGFDSTWLSELVRDVAYQHRVDELVDSLRTVIPVIYAPDEN